MSNRYGMMTETKVFPEYQAESSDPPLFFREETSDYRISEIIIEKFNRIIKCKK